MNEQKKEYYERNKKRILQQRKDHYKANRERINTYHREYYLRNQEKLREASQKNKRSLPLKERWARVAVYQHKSKGFLMEITPKELFEIAEQTDKCQMCGSELQYYKSGKNGPTKTSASLDRMNNENKINKENILILCWECNVTKGQRTMREFYEYCKFIAGKDFSVYEKK